MLKRAAAIAAASLALALPAVAGPAGDIARDYLYRGDPAGGLKAIEALGSPTTTAEEAFGEGMLLLAQTFEGLSQALYRHGFGAPNTGPLGPVIPMPIPTNPTPEPLDYEGFRAILDEASKGFSLATDRFGLSGDTAGDEGDFKVRIDPLKVRIDVNGDGKVEDGETIGRVLMGMLQMDPSGMAATPSATTSGRTQSSTAAEPAMPDTEIAFDRADAYWLSGYSSLVHSQVEFLLAHDFSDFFNAVFHRFFPDAGLPMQEFSSGGQLMLDPESDNAIADAIAAIHTINWPVIDKERLRMIQFSLGVVTDTSRANWEAILAETDDDHELLPGPHQRALDGSKPVTQEMVDAWLATLDSVDKVLDGKLLLPHWRFKQGFDLKAYFDTAERTDFVMILSGYGALPFLKDGPVATAEDFAAANRVFGDNLLGYAFWFN